MAKNSARKRAADDAPVGLRAVTHGNQTVYIPENADPQFFDEPVTQETVLDAALQGVMVELGERDDQAKVSVYRVALDGGVRKEAFLYECHPNSFTLADLQESYGAGDYRINVYGKQEGTNYKVIHANKRVTIGPTREQAKIAAAPKAAAVAAPAAGASATDPALLAILGGLTQALQALGKLSAGAGTTRADMLAEMKLLAEIVKPAGGADPMAQFQTAIAIAANMKKAFGGGDGEGGEANEFSVILKALESFAPAIMAKLAPGASSPTPAPALNAPLAQPAAIRHGQPAPGAPVHEEEIEMDIITRGALAMVKAAAKANDDAEKWSIRVYEDAPDDLLEAVSGADWFEKLCALDPEFAAYKPWLEQVRAGVLADIAANASANASASAPPGGALTEGSEGGKTGSAAVNGAAGSSVAGEPAK